MTRKQVESAIESGVPFTLHMADGKGVCRITPIRKSPDSIILAFRRTVIKVGLQIRAATKVVCGWSDAIPKGQTMKILLQHSRTQLYFRGLGDWTANFQEAFDFQHSKRATDFAHQNRLSGVQIAVRFFDSQFDEVFPLVSANAVEPTAHMATV